MINYVPFQMHPSSCSHGEMYGAPGSGPPGPASLPGGGAVPLGVGGWPGTLVVVAHRVSGGAVRPLGRFSGARWPWVGGSCVFPHGCTYLLLSERVPGGAVV